MSSVVVIEGSEMVLEQKFAISPKAAEWTKDGKLIVGSKKYKKSVVDKNAVLTVTNAESSDSGVYKVTVGRRSKQMVVQVEPKETPKPVEQDLKEVSLVSLEDDKIDVKTSSTPNQDDTLSKKEENYGLCLLVDDNVKLAAGIEKKTDTKTASITEVVDSSLQSTQKINTTTVILLLSFMKSSHDLFYY